MTLIDIRVLRADDLNEFRQWDLLVDASPAPDVYYRPGYAILHSCRPSENPVALLGTEDATQRFLIPLVLRPAPFFQGNQFDAFTPYGYGGVCALSTDFPRPGELVGMLESIGKWALDERLVCCIFRLHPLLMQSDWRPAIESLPNVRISRFSRTVAVDLYGWDSINDRPDSMSKGRCSDLAFARRTLRATVTQPFRGKQYLEELSIFERLYGAAMERVNADPFLRFGMSYFERASELLREKLVLVLLWSGEQPVGGAIFFADGLRAHYHLSALTDHGRACKAGTLAIVEGARWARDRGCRWLHLGGGNNREDDTLFQFKRSFGGSLFEYVALTFIVNPEEFARIKSMPDSGWPYR